MSLGDMELIGELASCRAELERQRSELDRVARLWVFTSRTLLEIAQLHEGCPPECPTMQVLSRYFVRVHLTQRGVVVDDPPDGAQAQDSDAPTV